jgi:Metallo-beta-lactamase superfamily
VQNQPKNRDRPDPDQVEISLFGPGLGESVVVHLGGNEWLVVDSCRDSRSNRPAALQYLDDIGVDPNRVVAVVASHWHDDHTRGLADLVGACPQAGVYVSAAFVQRDVRALVELNGGTLPKAGGGTREMYGVFRKLEESGRNPRIVGAQRIVHRRRMSGRIPDATVISLSPSDAAVHMSIRSMISDISTSGSQRTFLPWRDPNHSAIVLWVQIGEARILLGADLEEVSTDIGWTAIVDDPYRDDRPAEVFKIPHHGSITSFVEAVWERLLVNRPNTALTPFRQGSVRLPTQEGVQLICERTDLVNITHRADAALPRVQRDSTVEKTLREAKIDVHQRAFPSGQVRLRRRDLSEQSGEWEVDLFGAANPLCT